jgi:molecular chaperone GrpE
MSDVREESPEDVEPRLEPAPPDESTADGPRLEEPPDDSPPPESPPIGPAFAEEWGRAIEALGDRLSLRLDAIQTVLERDSRAEATRERVVDRLHAELQDYKQDLLLKVQRPIFIDLIQLHDDVGKMIEARAPLEDDGDRTAAVRGLLESIQVAIEDILYRQGVEPFAAEGDAFDPRRQRAIATVPTDDPARNKAIAVRLRKGFQAGEKLIRPELVSVYTYRPPAPAEPSD